MLSVDTINKVLQEMGLGSIDAMVAKHCTDPKLQESVLTKVKASLEEAAVKIKDVNWEELIGNIKSNS